MASRLSWETREISRELPATIMLSFPEVKEDSYKSPSDGPEVKAITSFVPCPVALGKLAYRAGLPGETCRLVIDK